jgi:cell division septation protein DedD
LVSVLASKSNYKLLSRAAWRPDGNCYPFDEASIELGAPPVSGVYGLHDERQQIFIGESADLRETLLQYRNDSRRLFRHLQPTGFSIEVCPMELCAQRARALIAQYRPLAPAPRSLAFAAPHPKQSRIRRSDFHLVPTSNAATPQWPAPYVEYDLAPAAKRYFLSRQQLVTIGAGFVATLLTVGYLGFFAGQRIGASRNLAIQLAVAKMPKAPVRTDGERIFSSAGDDKFSSGDALSADRKVAGLKQPEKDESPRRAVNSQSSASTPAISQTAPNRQNKTAGVGPDRALEAAQAAQEQPLSQPARPETPSNSWSVQVASTQDQAAARLLLNQLKAKGYDVYIFEAEFNSSRWFRVRVGQLQTQQEANLLREALASKEKFTAAFVTGK